jgi:hypothetical protein
MRTKIYIFTKECLLGTMMIIKINTLFRGDGIEWARVLWERMHVTGIGCDTVLNMTDALN